MPKKISQHQKNLPPSKRVYADHLSAPSGCHDVWRVNVVKHNPEGRYNKQSTVIHSQWFSRVMAMQVADVLWSRNVSTPYPSPRKKVYYHVYVEHKAAIKLAGKWHIVNIPSFTPGYQPDIDESVDFTQKTTTNTEPDPDPDHKQWLAEFDGKDVDSLNRLPLDSSL